ncbi:heterokaryon incompatibility protein-domain-containing protein [Xylariales sp. PMI_506]|nr:heterokaryon incompatibility protein-domain-containing protein [Xylariales sp. PMI_506]
MSSHDDNSFASLRAYQHDKLQCDKTRSCTAIRLARLLQPRVHSVNSQTPLVSLQIVDLEHEFPPYTALSYTWGPAQIELNEDPKSRNQPAVPEVKPILVDSMRFDVQLNLFDALCHLGSFRSGEYIWIDAICINQADQEEKTTQVAIMDLIYKKASKTTVWLGRESIHTTRAVELLSSTAQVGRRVALDIGRSGYWHEPPPRDDMLGFQKYGLPKLKENDWVALHDVFGRQYFGRVWMTQEVALSRKLEVVCGYLTLNWDHIATFAIFVYLNRSFLSALRGAPPATMAARISTGMGIVHVVGMQVTRLRCRIDEDAAMLAVVERFNWSASTDNREAENSFGGVMFALLQMNARFAATNIKDKIYSLYGIVKHMCPNQILDPELYELYKLNYSHSEAEVFIRFARGLIKETGLLHVLTFAGDSYPPEIDGLPSWVPDFVGRHSSSMHGDFAPSARFPALNALGRDHENRGNWRSCISVVDEGMRLHVSAHHVAEVAGVGETWSEMSSQYRVTDTLQMLLKHVAPIYPYRNNESRGEALWRTLVFDKDLVGRPASLGLGSSFRIYLGLTIVLRFVALLKAGYTQQQAAAASQPHILNSLAATEQHRAGQFIPTWAQVLVSLIQLGCVPGPADGSIRRAEDLTALSDMMAARTLPFENIVSDGSMHYRRLFATGYGHIGCGPQSMVAGDGIWIVAGCPSPLVLRKIGSESFQIIGEAYVHGIMSGEAITGNVQWNNICLV